MAKKIFVDTNPIIYFLNKDTNFYDDVLQFFTQNLDAEFYTSTITDAEVFVKFYEANDTHSKENYLNFLKDFNFLKCFINENIAQNSAHIRAKYNTIKLADALQIASAIECDCDVFYTNDKQLKQIAEINVVNVR